MPLGANKVALYGASADTGSAVLLSTATASSSASIEFTLPTAYKQVKFGFYGLHPSASGPWFQFQGSTDGGSNYNVPITSSAFAASNTEILDNTGLDYWVNMDEAQTTSYQSLMQLDDDSDAGAVGELILFNPPSTTYVKHWISRSNAMTPSGTYQSYCVDFFIAGYFNTTSAINSISFKPDTGNIDEGTIKMWGVR